MFWITYDCIIDIDIYIYSIYNSVVNNREKGRLDCSDSVSPEKEAKSQVTVGAAHTAPGRGQALPATLQPY